MAVERVNLTKPAQDHGSDGRPPADLLAEYLYGALALAPERIVEVVAAAQVIAGHESHRELRSFDLTRADDFWPTNGQDSRSALRPYFVHGGILRLHVQGILLHDFPWKLGAFATGYHYLQRAFERGVADYRVGRLKGIALIIDSPGGMVAGCFDAIDRAWALKRSSGVPVQSFCDNRALSAGYAWATLGDRFTVARSTGVGSIGVVRAHVSRAKLNEKQGIKHTFIHAGKHKVDGNSEQPLPPEVRARWQAEIEELNDIFVATVARNRRLKADQVKAMEARTFTPSKAIEAGLADEITSLDDGLRKFGS